MSLKNLQNYGIKNAKNYQDDKPPLHSTEQLILFRSYFIWLMVLYRDIYIAREWRHKCRCTYFLPKLI